MEFVQLTSGVCPSTTGKPRGISQGHIPVHITTGEAVHVNSMVYTSCCCQVCQQGHCKDPAQNLSAKVANLRPVKYMHAILNIECVTHFQHVLVPHVIKL